MNPLSILKYAKWIGIGLLVVGIGLVIWNIKSTYAENDQLKVTIKTKDASIDALKFSVKQQKEVNDELLKRKQEVEIVEKERIVYINKIVKGDTVYIETTKKEAEEIKNSNPELLANFYINRYNTILQCIADTTEGKEDKCATP
jgi:cell division protein FtsB